MRVGGGPCAPDLKLNHCPHQPFPTLHALFLLYFSPWHLSSSNKDYVCCYVVYYLSYPLEKKPCEQGCVSLFVHCCNNAIQGAEPGIRKELRQYLLNKGCCDSLMAVNLTVTLPEPGKKQHRDLPSTVKHRLCWGAELGLNPDSTTSCRSHHRQAPNTAGPPFPCKMRPHFTKLFGRNKGDRAYGACPTVSGPQHTFGNGGSRSSLLRGVRRCHTAEVSHDEATRLTHRPSVCSGKPVSQPMKFKSCLPQVTNDHMTWIFRDLVT